MKMLVDLLPDPLLKLSGAIKSPIADIAAQHDEYIGEGGRSTHIRSVLPPIFIDTAGWACFFIEYEPFHEVAGTLIRSVRNTGRPAVNNELCPGRVGGSSH